VGATCPVCADRGSGDHGRSAGQREERPEYDAARHKPPGTSRGRSRLRPTKPQAGGAVEMGNGGGQGRGARDRGRVAGGRSKACCDVRSSRERRKRPTAALRLPRLLLWRGSRRSFCASPCLQCDECAMCGRSTSRRGATRTPVTHGDESFVLRGVTGGGVAAYLAPRRQWTGGELRGWTCVDPAPPGCPPPAPPPPAGPTLDGERQGGRYPILVPTCT